MTFDMAKAGMQTGARPSLDQTSQHERDRFWMGFALLEAKAAREAGEVPVGAVVVIDDRIAGRGHNEPIGRCDPTAHAEVIAIREAALRVGNYRLADATLYATIEPCAMCAGAIVQARIQRLVYGAADTKAGGVESVFSICTNSSLNHQVEVESGVDADASRELMQGFFRERRKSAGVKEANSGAGGVTDRSAADE
ncbi:MAG: tRNA adenosine(34) deaminase TadA [Blastocatellales bacterium]|nr:tRNA adenosine(34) deaminase TadA [Blastocatellales bacterium]